VYFRNKGFLLYFFIFLSISSCSFPGRENPSFSIMSKKVITGSSSAYNIGVLIFVLHNFDEREISSIVFDFDVYDIYGKQQPQIGKNHIESSLEIQILSGSRKTITVVLDSLFSLPASETLTVTRFCITRINYSDNSYWSDEFRQFQIMASEIEVETLEEVI